VTIRSDAARSDLAERVAAAFRDRTGRDPEGVWAAPGRVNLIGDHTDHSGGFALPFAIDRHVVAATSRRDDGTVRAWSLQEPASAAFDVASIGRFRPAGWAAYVAGVVWSLRLEGVDVGGLEVVIDGRVPPGAGLASSAAIACATALAIADLHGADLDRTALALAAQRAEVEVVGVPCGVLDQLAVTTCREGSALFLDARSLRLEHVPLALDRVAAVVVDTGMPRRLTGGGYARRRTECDAAARELGVASLRDATPSDLERAVDGTLLRRARHVVTENARVLEVAASLRQDDIERVGPLLNASHASLRDDFEVSTPELDAAVEDALEAGALGARLTGAGFGGCAIALVSRERLEDVVDRFRAPGPGGERRAAFEVAAAGGALRMA
jgi:galactokinase